jgi:hypothetical protein
MEQSRGKKTERNEPKIFLEIRKVQSNNRYRDRDRDRNRDKDSF